MLEELKHLVIKIQREYNRISELWLSECEDKEYNLNKSLIKQIESSSLLDSVFDYTSFLNDNIFDFNLSLNNWKENNSEVSTRVKARNSILFKIGNYQLPIHQNGEIPVKKCLNDLFGIRIIFDGDYSHEVISKYIKKEFKELKCICSDKQEYIATHIYFKKKGASKIFQWELQVWLKNNEINNKVSHNKYKQSYVKWEKEIKEGSN
ncbi:MAG: hypothetical protein K2I30_06415 [Clostridia bacterium]|nr:hypothetical protein [Clostridia bacterium]